MDDAVRAAVAARAAHRCEYCQLHELDDAFTFHVEHIIALKHGGSQLLDNLAYACQHCNLRKGPNLSGIDPDSGAITSIFHPRQQAWADHFAVDTFSDCRSLLGRPRDCSSPGHERLRPRPASRKAFHPGRIARLPALSPIFLGTGGPPSVSVGKQPPVAAPRPPRYHQ